MYMEPLAKYDIINEREHVSIFCNIKQIRNVNKDLLKDLRSGLPISECFLRVVSFILLLYHILPK